MVGVFLYFRRFLRLPEEVALQKATAIAWKFWQAYALKMPAILKNPGASADELLEAGLVLKALVVGEVRDSSLSSYLTAPHPELAAVDAYELAQSLAQKHRLSYEHLS
jgi:hypothetical protein